MAESDILIADVKGNIGTLTINRPERRNALSPDLLIKLHLTLGEWAKQGAIRVVIITGGAGKAFSSGFDIASIPAGLTPEMEELMKTANPLELALTTVKNFPYPTIAMMNGYAFGAGCNLTVCCDIRIAVDDVSVGMPPAKLGLVYHPEGLRQFIEVVGMARAREIFFSGRTYRGAAVLAMGLVNYLVPRTELEEKTWALAEEIAVNAPLSLRGMKRIFNMLGESAVLGINAAAEADQFIAEAFRSEDLREGQTAFFEKRTPVFKGR